MSSHIRVFKQGRYKTLTNAICSDTIDVLKRTKHLKRYQRVKIRYEETEDRPIFAEQASLITLGTYTSVPLDMIFNVFLKINRDFGTDKVLCDGYAHEGETDSDGNIIALPFIELNIAFPGINEEKHYVEIMCWLKDIVRHEIEHLTQRGINAKFGKHRNLNFSKRAEIAGRPENFWKYFVLADEIEPNLHGLRSMSRYRREPYNKTIDWYLNYLQNTGTIQPEHKKLILTKWRKVGKRLNLPNF